MANIPWLWTIVKQSWYRHQGRQPPKWAAKWIGANFPVCCRRSILSPTGWCWTNVRWVDFHLFPITMMTETTMLHENGSTGPIVIPDIKRHSKVVQKDEHVDSSQRYCGFWWIMDIHGWLLVGRCKFHPQERKLWRFVDHCPNPVGQTGVTNSSCNMRSHVRDAWFRLELEALPKPRTIIVL